MWEIEQARIVRWLVYRPGVGVVVAAIWRNGDGVVASMTDTVQVDEGDVAASALVQGF